MAEEKTQERCSRYQLRYAAGLYWLTDLEQEGIPYRKPLALNRVGADIWRLVEQGELPEEIIERLSREYQADREMIRNDVSCFLKKLEDAGII